MRQIAYPAALGSCVVGAGAAFEVRAAEWSVTPFYSSSVDYDSNRTLQAAPDSQGSAATVLTADLRFKHALENSDWFLEPRYALRRYTLSKLGNGDDRSISGGFDWLGERGALSLTASLWDQSTLQTEALETGILSANTKRRLEQASGNWTWNQSERRQLLAQIGYSDVSYHGELAPKLEGYRYSSAMAGERYLFSERVSFTVSAYGSALSSDARIGGSSHQYGLQGQLQAALSEQIRIDASLGESTRRLYGSSGHGTDAAVTLTRDLSLGSLALSYTRSLVPQGTGILVQREQVTATAARPLTSYVEGYIQVTHIRNNETAVLLGLERHSYDSVTANLSWRPVETFSVGAQVANLRTEGLGLDSRTVHQWRGSVTLTWSPIGSSRSW